jgi:histidine ammonia-lyase
MARVPHSIVLTGEDLTADDMVAVARHRAAVKLAPEAYERIRCGWDAVRRAAAEGRPVYGLTTGVGAHKRVSVDVADTVHFNGLLLQSHRVGQGPAAPAEVVRAALVRLVNGYAKGTAGVRPELADRLLETLNSDEVPRVRMLGSVGQADLAPMADLAAGAIGDLAPIAKETLSLVNTNAFSTAIAALAIADVGRLLDALDVCGALDLDAFAANLTPLHPAVAEVRPYPGLVASLERLTDLLDGSPLWGDDVPRNLQDPLSFRCLANVQGAARDALGQARRQLAIELNASQENPLVIVGEDRIVSVANFDVVPLAAAVDYLRIGLAPALTCAAERTVKLLSEPFSGLPTGLKVRADLSDDALSEFGTAAVAISAEARLLAAPVSFELASSGLAEGIEDRMTMAPLGARRLAEMVGLGERICAICLVVASQAIDLRRPAAVGAGSARAHALVRALVPFTGAGEPPPLDLEPVVDLVRSGELGAAPQGSRA